MGLAAVRPASKLLVRNLFARISSNTTAILFGASSFPYCGRKMMSHFLSVRPLGVETVLVQNDSSNACIVMPDTAHCKAKGLQPLAQCFNAWDDKGIAVKSKSVGLPKEGGSGRKP